MIGTRVEKFYTAMERMAYLYDLNGRRMGFDCDSIGGYATWKKEVRAKLSEITGIEKMQACDLTPEVSPAEAEDGYDRTRIVIQCEPGVRMPMFMLKPNGIKPGEKRPVVICPHGHGSAGKNSPAGITSIPPVAEAVKHFNYDYGVQFAKRGFVVFCPDARAFGERRENTLQGDDETSFMNSSCMQLNHMAICLGLSLTGMWTFDLIRLIDYIETRDDCDAGRVACAGLSGGGLQTLWLAAMDDRVKCAVTSGYFYGYKDSLLRLSGNCACNYVPHLWEYVDMCDLGALIAPRPLLVETGDMDPLNGERGVANVTEQLEITKKAYRLYGAVLNVSHAVFHGEHRWGGEATYDFVTRALCGEG